MAWDPDALVAGAATNSAAPTTKGWDPDAMLDEALKPVDVTAKRMGTVPNQGPLDDVPDWSKTWGMAKNIGKQLLGGALDSARTMTGAETQTQAQSNEAGLGLGPSTDPSLQNVRSMGGFLAPSPATEGQAALEGGMGPAQQAPQLAAGTTAGQATGSPALQAIEQTVARTPGGQGLAQNIVKQKAGVASQLQDTISDLSGGRSMTPYAVGSTVDAGLAKGAQDLKDAGGALFDKADALVPTGTEVKPTLLTKVLGTQASVDPNFPRLSKIINDPLMTEIKKAMEGDMAGTEATPSGLLGADGKPIMNPGSPAKTGIPYSTMQDLMQKVNKKIDWTGLAGNADNGAWKQVYLAMRNDANTTAAAVSPQASTALQVAKSNWQDVVQRLTSIESAMQKNGGVEDVFNRMVSKQGKGPSNVMTVLDTLPESSQKLVAGSMLQRMGTSKATDTAGQFDADTFIKNWGNMDPDAKNRLFGSLPQQYQQNLDKLVTNIKAIRAYGKVLPNSSNTAGASAWLGSLNVALYAALQGDFKTAATVGAAMPTMAWAASKALTNPQLVKWLVTKSDPAAVLKLGRGASAAQAAVIGSNQTSPSDSPANNVGR